MKLDRRIYKWRGARSLYSFAGEGLLGALESVEARRSNVLRVLAYHRIDTLQGETALDPSLVSATPQQFYAQMRFLAHHYHPFSLDELLFALDSGTPLPPRSVMVTFDDAYRDFLQNAWPVLQQFKIPAILFVPTDFVSNPGQLFWWDQLCYAMGHTDQLELDLPSVGHWSLRTRAQRHRAFEALKRHLRNMEHEEMLALLERLLRRLEVRLPAARTLLTWEELQGLSAQGLYVAAHTRSHPILSHISLDAARAEIHGSQQAVRDHLGRAWPVFAYPSGHDADLQPGLPSLLQEEGFRVAMTLIEGHNVLGRTSPLLLRRLGVGPRLSTTLFRLLLTVLYDVYGAAHRFQEAHPLTWHTTH